MGEESLEDLSVSSSNSTLLYITVNSVFHPVFPFFFGEKCPSKCKLIFLILIQILINVLCSLRKHINLIFVVTSASVVLGLPTPKIPKCGYQVSIYLNFLSIEHTLFWGKKVIIIVIIIIMLINNHEYESHINVNFFLSRATKQTRIK